MFPPSRVPHDADAAIRATDTDAAGARLSAVQKGYLVDPYARHLAARAHLQPPRPPLINVGTYVRTAGIDNLVEGWLDRCAKARKECQIVSLGAGSDTRFWRLAASPWKDVVSKYIEIDFPEITMKKAMSITKSRDLSNALGTQEDIRIVNGGTGLHAPRYCLLGVDLRLPPSETLTKQLASPHLLSPNVPTLLLFECVLVYMTPHASSQLIQWFVDYFQNDGTETQVLGGIVYEMFGLNDAFGRVMVNNLKTRNVSLLGAEPYPTVESLPNRFLQHGFRTSQALTLREIRSSCISDVELERISKLEMLDEVEELDLVLAHYAITWGLWIKGSASTDWDGWGLVKLQRDDGSTSE